MNDYTIPVCIVLGIVIGELIRLPCRYYKSKWNRATEVFFIMMGEPKCCKPFERSIAPTPNCKKYCKGKLLQKFQTSIVEAKASICIAMYNFNCPQIADFILLAHQKNVQIRLLIDKSNCDTNENRQAKRLHEAGISVRMCGDGTKKMHHKFCLIDGTRSDGVLITGSLNWTYSAFALHCENVAFIHSKRIQRQYREAFDRLWNKYATPYVNVIANPAASASSRRPITTSRYNTTNENSAIRSY